MSILPSGWGTGQIRGMDQGRQVGWVGNDTTSHAALWSGTTESFVDLNPASYGGSEARAIAGDQQAGIVKIEGQYQAALWRGTAKSFVNLHPPAASWSRADATDGVRQGGWIAFRGVPEFKAALWSGTAESYVDMHPAGMLESRINAMAISPSGVPVQAGYIDKPGAFIERAAIWHGSAESYVDITPPGRLAGIVWATDGTLFAGVATNSGPRAGVWMSEDPASFVDLHALLPPNYTYSAAYAVRRDGDVISVAGMAHNDSGAPADEAFLWTLTVPAPGGAVLVLGLGLLGLRRPSPAPRAIRTA